MTRTPTERRSERRQNNAQTRPDQTRVFVTAVCGLSVVKIHHHLQAVTREPSPQSDDDLRYAAQTNNGDAA